MNNFAKSQLDRSDRAILNLIQRNNQMTHAEIGELVGLSTSAVRRRINSMRKSGVIDREVAILSDQFRGVTLIVSVRFAQESPEIYRDFEAMAEQLPEVTQCYHVSGNSDYVLVVQVPDLEYYETWSKDNLMRNEAIKRFDSIVAWSCKKFETAIALDD